MLSTRPRLLLAAVGAVCGALVGGFVTPASAAEPGDGATPSVLGPFALGDELEGAIDERDGAVQLSLPVAGLTLGWDSRALAANRYALGSGWSFGLGYLDTRGGVRVFPASGGAYSMNVSHPSGLDGYRTNDLVFEPAEAGVLPGRADGVVDEQRYAYALHEAGGVSTYFDDRGDPLATVRATGDRQDWGWGPGDTQRQLLQIVDPVGSVTTLDWESEPDTVVVRPGANITAPRPGSGAGAVWRIRLDQRSGVAGIVDPEGVEASVWADASGLITGLRAPSGVETRIDWRHYDDGSARAGRARALDRNGRQLSFRSWEPAAGSPAGTGWPLMEPESGALGVNQAHAETVLSDGVTEVRSHYSPLGTLVERGLVSTSGAGRQLMQQTLFGYPGLDEHGRPVGTPADLPGNWSRPDEVTIVHHDARGATRSVRQQLTFDEQGRVRSQLADDGTRTELVYDDVVAPPTADRPGAADRLPVGLPVLQRRIGVDGSVTETRSGLNEARTAPAVVEEFAGRLGDDGSPAELVRTGRVEYEVGRDGIVSEERAFPSGDASAEPRVTRRTMHVDPEAGEVTTTVTVSPGDSRAATTSSTRSLVHGGSLVEHDALGNRSSKTYDELGRVRTVIDARGRESAFAYERGLPDGRNATTVLGADGVAATEVRDELGRVIEVSDNICKGVATPGHVRVAETRAYPQPGQVEVTDAWGTTTSSRQDALGRVVERRTASGLVELTRFDDVAGTVTTALTPTGRLADAEQVRTDRVDGAGRVVQSDTERADGREVPSARTEYDDRGRVVLAGSAGVEARTEYDVFGNATRVAMTERAVTPEAPGTSEAAVTSEATIAPEASASPGALADVGPETSASPGALADVAPLLLTERRFDGFGRSVEKTLSDATTSRSGGTRSVDVLGRATEVRDPAGGVWRYEFTLDGLVKRAEAPSGQVTTVTYDPISRKVTEEVVTSPIGATVATGYAYDELTEELVAIWDCADPEGSRIDYELDAHGNVLRTTYPDGSSIRNEYDAHGRRVATIDVAENRTDFTYDAVGLLIESVQTDADGRPLASVRATHDAFGRMIELERGNGVRTAYTFTSASQIETETTTHDGRPVSERRYEYDERGNLASRVDDVHGDDGAVETTTTSYDYDAIGRLVGSVRHRSGGPEGGEADAPATVRTDYAVTASLDIAAETVTEQPGTPDEQRTTREFSYSLLGELIAVSTTGAHGEVTSQSQVYDAAANLTHALDGTEHAYDAANRQVAETATDGTTVETAYWADGTRRQRTVSAPDGTTSDTVFYWDGGALMNDVHTGDGAGTAAYLIGASRHARSVSTADGDPSAAYYGTDRHGNVTELTGDRGEVIGRYEYADYGSVITAPPVGTSPHDGVTYNPFQYAGEHTDRRGVQHLASRFYDTSTHRFQNLDRADQFNRFAFADLNPIMMVDPSGRTADWDTIVNGAVIGAGVLAAAITLVAAAVTAAASAAAVAAAVAAGATAPTAGLGFFAALGVSGGIGVGADLIGAGLASSVLVLRNVFKMNENDPVITGLQWGEAVIGLGVLFGAKAVARAMEHIAETAMAKQWGRKVGTVYWFFGTSQSRSTKILAQQEALAQQKPPGSGFTLADDQPINAVYGDGIYLTDSYKDAKNVAADAQLMSGEAGEGVVLIVAVDVRTAVAFGPHRSGVTIWNDVKTFPRFIRYEQRAPNGRVYSSFFNPRPGDEIGFGDGLGPHPAGTKQMQKAAQGQGALLIHPGDFNLHASQLIVKDPENLRVVGVYDPETQIQFATAGNQTNF